MSEIKWIGVYSGNTQHFERSLTIAYLFLDALKLQTLWTDNDDNVFEIFSFLVGLSYTPDDK